MSSLHNVATKAKSIAAEKAPATGMLNQLTAFLHRPETGGLTGLVSMFDKAGLSAKITSWIGTGDRLPITPDEVTRVFGGAEVSRMATKAGITPDQASQQLSQLLPDVVNHLMPGGKVPGAAAFGELVGSLKDKFTK